MPISEDIITGKKYRVWSVLANKWKRYSFWSKASDTELNDGTTVEATIGVLKSSIPQNNYYDSEAEAEADLNNIPDGALVYTNDGEDLQDIIDGMTAIHLASSQLGAGTKNFTFNTEAQKRMLCITKKSGVVVESKEIPVDVLSTGDVIPLGITAPVIGNGIAIGLTDGTNNAGFFESSAPALRSSNPLYGEDIGIQTTGSTHLTQGVAIGVTNDPDKSGLVADLGSTLGASLTYNGNDSFTITVTDSSLSVYVYVDMLVLGGSASGRNVSFDAAGTSLESTDVEGAIKEISSDLIELEKKCGLPSLNYSTPLHTFSSGNLSYTVTDDEAYILGKMSGSTTNLSINDTVVAAGTNGYNGNAVNDNVSLIKVTKGDIVAVSGASAQLHVFGLKV